MGIFLLLLPLPLCAPSHPSSPPPFFLCSLSLFLAFHPPSSSPPPSLCLLPHHTHRSLCFLLALFMGFSCDNVLDEEQSEVHLTDETVATQQRTLALMEVRHHQQQGVESEADFWPVEHPLEPRDEDRPVKCPMPQSSVINEGGVQEKRFAESIRKRVEASAEMAERGRREGMEADPPDLARAVRKRHHTLTQEGELEITPFIRTPPLPPLPSQNVTVFQMFQQVDKFDS
ncbi:uncharacterized protein LOC129311023 [Prosopis cineraria]|uniref:uncharacterized protein LOC129311023 n=1 Tax=Prosopis cineraria TaxID=364024 RepID=UPI00240F554E|nr:uncharacterized protein LOC129311023 [Prosopis cineraria]